MINLRLSPSGPVIATSGSGVRLRLEENTAANSNVALVTTGSAIVGDAENVVLQNPRPDRSYRGMGRVLVRNDHPTDTAQITAELELSYDGSTWFKAGTPTQFVIAALESNFVPANMDKTLGANLAVPVVAQAELHARLFLTASANGIANTVATRTYHLELEEIF